MKNSFRGQKAFVFFLFTVLFAVSPNLQIRAQDKKPFADYNEILSELTFTSSISKSKEQLNDELIESVKTRGVEFVLLEEDEQALRNAGANDSLIKAIFEGLPDAAKRNLRQNLYANYMESVEKLSTEILREKIKSAKKFIRLFDGNAEDKEVVDYFNKNLPLLEKQLSNVKKQKIPIFKMLMQKMIKNPSNSKK